MSPERQGRPRPQPRPRVRAAPMPSGVTIELAPSQGFDLHVHERHQLALAASGVLIMSGTDRSWVLPRTRALWIPADYFRPNRSVY